jgi:uncharacterized protein (DUF486 family)
MTFAWYGHLKWKTISGWEKWGLAGVIVFSWGIAFFEYLLMIPANRLGSRETGGSLDMFQLRLLQEVISMFIFTLVVMLIFKGETLHWRYALAFCLMLVSIWLVLGKS